MKFQENLTKRSWLLMEGDLIEEVTSKFQNIKVIKTDLGKTLVLDDFIMSTEKNGFVYHEMITSVPIRSHKNPRDILILGGGDGLSLFECLKYKTLRSIDICEIDKTVIEVSCRNYRKVERAFSDKRTNIIVDDAFKYLQKTTRKYDIVIFDINDPFKTSKRLYSKKSYDLAANALKKGGIVCTIGTTPFYSLDQLLRINRNLHSVFKYVEIFMAFVPDYHSGCWTFFLASNSRLAKKPIKRTLAYSGHFKYYNDSIHQSCFSLPEFLRQKL